MISCKKCQDKKIPQFLDIDIWPALITDDIPPKLGARFMIFPYFCMQKAKPLDFSNDNTYSVLIKTKMKNIFLPLILLITTLSYGQKNIYESNRFDALSENHKVLAIIPFLTNLDLKENITAEERKNLEKKEGYAVQNALETYFNRGKKKKKFTIEFQNVQNTNAILAKNNIDYNNIDIHTIKELCGILEVDGIISGNLDLNILLSNGIPTEMSFMDYILGVANYGRIGIKISDGTTGKLLWKYEKEINKKSGKNTNDLIDGMMKKATRKFPYDKERPKNKKQ